MTVGGQATVMGGAWVNTNAVGTVGINVRGFTGQTADLQDWLSSTSAVLAKVDASGNLSTTGNLSASGNLSVTGTSTFTGTTTHNGNLTVANGTTTTFNNSPSFAIATGTQPFTVTSTTQVTNLNASYVDGYNSTRRCLRPRAPPSTT